LPVKQWLDEDDQLHEEPLREKVVAGVAEAYEKKSAEVGDNMRQFEKQIMLQVLDTLWKEHLATMDHLRQGIGLRAYAQKNPKQEYKREAFAMFQEMLDNLKFEVVRFLSHVKIQQEDELQAIERQREEAAASQQMEFNHAETSALESGPADTDPQASAEPFKREGKKVGRNEPCPCGSGKKFKQCHVKLS
jgi:preprotein translocase subunit SecA